MTLAAKARIEVAETQVLTLANGLHAIAVRRFDRKADQRIHSISAGTALRAVAAESFAAVPVRRRPRGPFSR